MACGRGRPALAAGENVHLTVAIVRYNAQVEPSEIVLDEERLQHWLDRGAQPTNTVQKLIRAKQREQQASAS